MGEEMLREAENRWNKSIPFNRDRLQSRALAWGLGSLLAGLCVHTAAFAYSRTGQLPGLLLGAIGISIVFSFAAWRLRAATPAGAVCGGMVCLLLTFWLARAPDSFLRSGLTPLALLFALTFTATRMGKQRKVKSGLAEGRRGRNAAQVIANLGVAGLTASWIGVAAVLWCTRHAMHVGEASLTSIGTVALAALAEATADTASSEIGQAFGGLPVLLTTLRRVAPGADGAITATGTVAGVIGAVAVTGAGQWALRLRPQDAGAALIGGLAGLFFDSLLGATVERRGWVGNDLVNFASTLFAAGVALGLLLAS